MVVEAIVEAFQYVVVIINFAAFGEFRSAPYEVWMLT
jgi:hypothetical protein